MDISKISFYDEKKKVVTNILDAAVKTLNFDQSSYLAAKAQLMRVVEEPGHEGLGLFEVVTMTNKLIEKVADHSGYLIVDSSASAKNDEKSVLAELNACEKVDAKEKGRAAVSVTQYAVSRRRTLGTDEVSGGSVKGKEKLLQLIHLLPPYISAEDAELYSVRIRSSPLGRCSSSKVARTTGDFEQLIVEQVLDVYFDEFDALVKQEPQAFVEQVKMVIGKDRDVDISVKLRQQLASVKSLAEFLSMRDLVNRHMCDYQKSFTVEKKKINLFFWQKE